MNSRYLSLTACHVLTLAVTFSGLLPGDDTLEQSFQNPPAAAKPGIWWRWCNGNVTDAGIDRDLSEYGQAGAGSVEMFSDIGTGLPGGPTRMMDPQWIKFFDEACRQAVQSGISIRMVPGTGWGNGAPWVGKDQASKKLVYSELQVDGPQNLQTKLPMPPVIDDWYRDVAVVAIHEASTRMVTPAQVTASSSPGGYCDEKNFPPADAVDGDPNTCWKSEAVTPGAPQWLLYTYDQPLTAVGCYLSSAAGAGPSQAELQSSDDGVQFKSIGSFNLKPGETGTIRFPATTARFFRLKVNSAYAPDIQLTEMQILRQGDKPLVRAGVKWWMFKSGNRSVWNWPEQPAGIMDEENDSADIADCHSAETVDLTSKMSANGTLDWDVPAGRWTILRFGSTLLGQTTRSALSGGFEGDLLDPATADFLFDRTTQKLLASGGDAVKTALEGLIVDSYEQGADLQGQQPTWTGRFPEEFKARRGYDLIRYLPALAHRVVDSRKDTDRFLWDFRLTFSDLYSSFYHELADRTHQAGLAEITAECGYGSYPLQQIDGLKAFSQLDVPEGEYWLGGGPASLAFVSCDSCVTASSAAHIYGKGIAAAESFTSFSPRVDMSLADYKPFVHEEFERGINRIMFHSQTLNADVKARPGEMHWDTLNPNMTWWPMADGLFNYIARCQDMLRQGVYVADVAYLNGEGAWKFVPARAFLRPMLPDGYDFDGMNADVVDHRMTVKDSRFTLPDGMSYRYLVLPDDSAWKVTPETLGKIEDLVKAGGTIIGPRPAGSPTLLNAASDDAEVSRMAEELWGANPAAEGENHVGQGRVIWGRSLTQIFAEDKLAPDFGTDSVAGASDALIHAQWIWHADDLSGGQQAPAGERWLRTSIDLPPGKKITSATALFSADDAFELSVNGQPAAHGEHWNEILPADITRLLHPGHNDLLAHATNYAPGPAGLIGGFAVDLDDGSRMTFTTGKDWETARDQQNWRPAQVIGSYGCAPWGDVLPTPKLAWIHRSTSGGEIYFVSNQVNTPLSLACTFRVSDRQPELWDPVTGSLRALPHFQNEQGKTRVSLSFAPREGYFIVFRHPIAPDQQNGGENFPAFHSVATLREPWDVSFDPAWGGPDKPVRFDTLQDWIARPEQGIRAYSGVATYRTTFQAPDQKGGPLFLDLGNVSCAARVRLNGKDLGPVWCAPYRTEIDQAIHAGTNQLEIEVANLWSNRMLADSKLPPEKQLTHTNLPTLHQDQPIPSGLLGPVTLQAEAPYNR
jgi:hypothetical protein